MLSVTRTRSFDFGPLARMGICPIWSCVGLQGRGRYAHFFGASFIFIECAGVESLSLNIIYFSPRKSIHQITCHFLQTTSVHALARQLLGSAYSNGVLELNASDSRGIDVSYDLWWVLWSIFRLCFLYGRLSFLILQYYCYFLYSSH